MTSEPYSGPYVVLTPADAKRVERALFGAQDDEAKAIKRKLDRAKRSDKKFLEPHK